MLKFKGGEEPISKSDRTLPKLRSFDPVSASRNQTISSAGSATSRSPMTTTELATSAAHARKNRHSKKGQGYPASSKVQYSDAETEFLLAFQAFKERTNTKVPPWSDALRVLQFLRYAEPILSSPFDLRINSQQVIPAWVSPAPWAFASGSIFQADSCLSIHR